MPPVPMTRCPSCGSPTGAAERFCRSCGNDLAHPVPLVDQPSFDDRTELLAGGSAGVDPRVADRLSTGDGLRESRYPASERHHVSGRPLAGGLLIALGVLLLAVGMIGSWAIIEGKITSPVGGRATPSPGGTAGASSRPTGASTSAPPSGPTGSIAPTGPTGPIVVAVAPALESRPETREVVDLFTTYFTAIDQRDFAALQTTLVPRPDLPQSDAEFRQRYKSTQDSNVRLLGLRSGPNGGLVASVSFTSHQLPADAPDGVSPCLNWSISYPLVRVDGALRIDEVGRSGLVRQRC